MKLSHASGAGYTSTARGIVTRHAPVVHRTIVAVIEGDGLLEEATVVRPGDLIDLVPGESFVIQATSAVLRFVEVPIVGP